MLVMVYEQTIESLTSTALTALVVWGVMWRATAYGPWWRRMFVASNVILSLVALCGILSFTVLGRASSGEHIFVLSLNPGHEEFVREMFMNTLLYLPLGLSLSAVIGPWVVPVGLALSIGIEGWQYVACTGTAQCTDVLCNVLGCAIGAMPRVWVDSGLWERLRGVRRKPCVGSEVQKDA